MATAIYSHCFQRFGPTVAGTYPQIIGAEGVVGVIRDMDFVAPGTGFVGLEGFRVDVTDFSDVFVAGVWFMGPGCTRAARSYHWRGRHVMPFESSLNTVTFEDGWSWNISGYLFLPP